ncbi:MAG TPA: hypothetical protein VGS41_13080 [Chthonomonadales bacterium]|nr:hypothetical protein [Chthonomonadales bacterium]
MARVVRRSTVSDGQMGVRFSELIVGALFVLAVAAGVRYFVQYRHSAGYAVESYLGAIKAGDVPAQYALLDNQDKSDFYPTEKDYSKNAPQAHGYVERISNVQINSTKIDPSKPNIARVDATVSVRGSSQGEALYQTSSDTYTDHYVLRQDASGAWKIWLKWTKMNILKATPSPPSDSFSS